MSRTVYVNGEYCAEEEARVSIFDRAFLFADAVYDATSVLGGKLLDYEGHMARFRRSLSELELTSPLDDDELLALHRELISRNNVDEGIVYLQVSRGAADRDFVFPNVAPTMIAFTQERELIDPNAVRNGIKVISLEDWRWHRRDVKTVQLLYASMAKMAAVRAGANDAWLVENGFVTEGTSNNAFIVTKSGEIVTRQLSNEILHGVTRRSVIKFAQEAQIKVVERPFTVEEAQNAAEAFITSAATFVYPVVEVDGKAVGAGTPGPMAGRLRELYMSEIQKTAI